MKCPGLRAAAVAALIVASFDLGGADARSGVVGGTIRGHAGEPQQGIGVLVEARTHGQLVFRQATRTDSVGRFQVAGIPRRLATVTVRIDDERAGRVPIRPFDASIGSDDIRILRRKAGIVRGVVSVPAGHALSGIAGPAAVEAIWRPDSPGDPGKLRGEVRTDGRFAIAGVPVDATVFVLVPRETLKDNGLLCEPVRAQVGGVPSSLRLSKGRSIRGRIVSELLSVSPADCRVELRGSLTNPSSKPLDSVVPSDEGDFEFKGLLDMGYDIAVFDRESKELVGLRRKVRPGDLTICLWSDPGRLPFVILGRPYESFRIRVASAGFQVAMESGFAFSASGRATGSLRVPSRSRKYSLYIVTGSGWVAASSLVPSGGEIRMARARTISGRVLGGTGLVSARWGEFVWTTRIMGDGTFRLEGLPQGKYEVVLWGQGLPGGSRSQWHRATERIADVPSGRNDVLLRAFD